MKVRIKFSKKGIMKFIGHLDMMRYFQKAFRRSGIDISYSQGFSPHQLISFAAPLGVGLTSRGEYMDIMMGTGTNSRKMAELLNAQMVEGVEILSCRQIEDETKHSNAMAILAAADYEVFFKDPEFFDRDMEMSFRAFMGQSHIPTVRKTKKGQREIDLKNLIYKWDIKDGHIFMRLATGSVDNLKPEFVIETFLQSLGKNAELSALDICRLEMYAKAENGSFISLEDLGKDIP